MCLIYFIDQSTVVNEFLVALSRHCSNIEKRKKYSTHSFKDWHRRQSALVWVADLRTRDRKETKEEHKDATFRKKNQDKHTIYRTYKFPLHNLASLYANMYKPVY